MLKKLDYNACILFDWSFFSFLIKSCFQNKNTPLGYLKKISSSGNILIEFMNYWFCTAKEKETVTIRLPKVPFCFFDKLKNKIQNFILRFCFYFTKEDDIQIIDNRV